MRARKSSDRGRKEEKFEIKVKKVFSQGKCDQWRQALLRVQSLKWLKITNTMFECNSRPNNDHLNIQLLKLPWEDQLNFIAKGYF